MALCQRCQAFDIQAFATDTTSVPWRSFRLSDVVQSAPSCHFCQVLFDLLSQVTDINYHTRRRWVRLEVERRDGHTEQKPLAITLLRAYVSTGLPFDNSQEPGTSFHVVADAGTPAATNQDIVGRYVPRDSGYEGPCSAIQDWLDSCGRESHGACWRTLSGCQDLAESGPLPTRCIEIKRAASADGLTFKLLTTSGLYGKYVSVSHRWVKPATESCSTTRQNLHQRLLGRCFENLPRIFLDVISLCFRLKVQYLWIDAICIVQDDEVDWKVESVKMSQYYQQSLFTIAATGEVHESGILSYNKSRSPPALVRLPYRNASGVQDGYLYLCPTDPTLSKYYWKEISQSELLTRGWVFQEWILSRRIICYTPGGLVLQCKSRQPRDEAGQLIEQTIVNGRGLYFYEQTMLSHLKFDMSSVTEIYDAWYRVVEMYSSLKLTYVDQDRLVALRGVVDEFGEALACLPDAGSSDGVRNHTYICGIWLGDITKSLMWQRTSTGVQKRINAIPSWSWASIDGGIRWGHHRVLWKREQWLTTTACCSVIKVLYPALSEIHLVDSETFNCGTPDLPRSNGFVGRDASVAGYPAPGERYPVLCIDGRITPILIHSQLPSENDRVAMADATHHKERSPIDHLGYGEIGWRTVSSPQRPGTLAGWANLEHPEFQENGIFDRVPLIHALIISKITGIYGGINFGYLSLWHHAYNVLFLRRSELIQDGYERVGVGRLFGREIDQDIRLARQRIIRLL